MAASVLQIFLRLQLLELNGDDSRLQKLEAAATELAGKFSAAPINALAAFLAVLDNASVTAESVPQAAEAIENHWSTYHGAFKDGQAHTLYRAVVLQALVETINFQPALGTAISLLLRNFAPKLEIGKNRPVFDLLIDAADTAFRSEATERTVVFSEQDIPYPQAAKSTKIDRAALQKRIDSAVGPTNRENQANENANGNWPNSGQPWSLEFSTRLTALLADHIDLNMAKASELDARNLKSLASYLERPDHRYNAILASTSLLWWRQALYSESADKSYRNLPAVDAVIHAVVDLSSLIPAAYERALESFLVETLLYLFPEHGGISQAEMLQASSSASSCLAKATEIEAPRGLLLSSVILGGTGTILLPVSSVPHEWGVWLLREMKALQAIATIKPDSQEHGEDE